LIVLVKAEAYAKSSYKRKAEMEWTTKVTELLDCRYPILQGAIARLGNWEFAACVARAGAHGTITASVCGTPQKLQEDIRKCRKAIAGSDGSIGVNLSIGITPRIEEMLEVCVEEKVPVETSIYKPDALASSIKAGGLKWIHKAARVKDAIHAQELGPDAIILVGLEGAGIKNPEQLPTMTTIIWGRRKIKATLIAAGGIGDAHGFLAALAMGADGIMMGSAFLATRESPIKDSVKERLLHLSPDNPEFRQRVMMPAPPKRPPDTSPESDEPDWSRAVSFAVGAIDHIPTVQELIDGIVNGAEKILDSWKFLQAR